MYYRHWWRTKNTSHNEVNLSPLHIQYTCRHSIWVTFQKSAEMGTTMMSKILLTFWVKHWQPKSSLCDHEVKQFCVSLYQCFCYFGEYMNRTSDVSHSKHKLYQLSYFTIMTQKLPTNIITHIYSSQSLIIPTSIH